MQKMNNKTYAERLGFSTNRAAFQQELFEMAFQYLLSANKN